jgi:hypothetical protein
LDPAAVLEGESGREGEASGAGKERAEAGGHCPSKARQNQRCRTETPNVTAVAVTKLVVGFAVGLGMGVGMRE